MSTADKTGHGDSHIHREPTQVTREEPNVAGSLIPVAICHEYYGGPLLTYLVNDTQALTLIHVRLLPTQATASRRKWREADSLIKTYRLPDGRVRLTISASLVRQRDAGFARFVSVVASGEAA
jgi:hypothetical protein